MAKRRTNSNAKSATGKAAGREHDSTSSASPESDVENGEGNPQKIDEGNEGTHDSLDDDSELPPGPSFEYAAAKAKHLPTTPGVYLMKDSAGVVIYIGKAKNLRSRAGSYFLKAALEDARTL
ncbi:MAG: GIY-YIG nuclease family protein, partial [Planctomycetota bacterium]